MNKVLYVGTFDPFTKGHYDIIKRSSIIHDFVIVVVFDSLKKCKFSFEQRIEMVQDCCKDFSNVIVQSFSGLLIDCCDKFKVYIVVRGLRNSIDYEYEKNMDINNKILNKRVEFLYLICNYEYSHISSSTVRELLDYNCDITHLVDLRVQKRIKEYNEYL